MCVYARRAGAGDTADDDDEGDPHDDGRQLARHRGTAPLGNGQNVNVT